MHLKIKKLKILKLISFPITKYNISKLHVFTKHMVYIKAPILFYFIWILF